MRRGYRGGSLADQQGRALPVLGRDGRDVVREVHRPLAVFPPVDVGAGGSGKKQKEDTGNGPSQDGERQPKATG